ncbi:hypothetical protein [Kordiimonas gwangyangensis]|uniref:hypothetical protein n=1 Tax=Kordiimonas gwangyangensis TaxID=288022 RepID=UPI00037B9B4D|nr:hypothetical protein [Kordiimonas gwangyangensis]
MSFKEMSSGKQANASAAKINASNQNLAATKGAPEGNEPRKATAQDEPPRKLDIKGAAQAAKDKSGATAEKKTAPSSPSNSN